MSVIHLIENDGRIEPVGADEYESGYWAVAEDTAKRLVGGSIYFHHQQAAPSFYGGIILGQRPSDNQEFPNRVIFRFRYSPDHRGVRAGVEGWGNEKKIVWDE